MTLASGKRVGGTWSVLRENSLNLFMNKVTVSGIEFVRLVVSNLDDGGESENKI